MYHTHIFAANMVNNCNLLKFQKSIGLNMQKISSVKRNSKKLSYSSFIKKYEPIQAPLGGYFVIMMES